MKSTNLKNPQTVSALIEPVFSHQSYRGASEAVKRGAAEIGISGLTATAKALVVAGLAHDLSWGHAKHSAHRSPSRGPSVVVITADNEAAERLAETTSTFLEWLAGTDAASKVGVLPAFDCSPYDQRSPHPEIAERRAIALWKLAQGLTTVLFVPLPAALGRFRSPAFYGSLALEIKVGEEIDLDDLVEHLTSVGYEPGEPVSEVGQYSVRGGIIDVFPPQSAKPLRIEFFGDQIESVREFDPSSQRSQKSESSVLLLPLGESTRSPGFFSSLVRVLSERMAPRRTQSVPVADRNDSSNLEGRSLDASESGMEDTASSASPSAADWASEYSAPFPGWEFFVPLVEPHPHTLLSLIRQVRGRVPDPQSGPGTQGREPITGAKQAAAARDGETAADAPLVIWDEKTERARELDKTLEGWTAAFEEMRDIVPPRPRPEDVYLRRSEFLKALEGSAHVNLKELSLAGDQSPATADGSLTAQEFTFPTQRAPKFHGAVKTFIEDLKTRMADRELVAFVIPTAGKVDRLREILKDYGIPFQTATAPAELTGPPGSELQGSGTPDEISGSTPVAPVLITRGRINEGVAFPDLRLLLLSDADLFGEFDWGSSGRRERSAASSFISDLSDLKVGDYVVHVDHGIGQYQGLRQLGVNGAERDFMLITYQEDARLYVLLERLDLVEKYRSAEGAKPVLDRLGGVTWARTKARVRRALRDMAQELLQLYAERKMKGGTAYSHDTPWQKEFEGEFEFEETPDQLTALKEIKSDLESPQPMDRLLCGDVGYGKTELAMRAAFKVVQDGKQVAVLAPTTVLAFQHYNTFRKRMAGFPVRTEMVSRFRTAAEQKKVLQETESGPVDILIGTHRLLSKDVGFRDLGLLIVDEEQRFGVAAKEKLKKIRAGVEVLTMSATPIPRTLNMSLGGLRDLSVIETPPRGRLAIQTVVAPFGPGIIQSAILQEMERQGQVYFVHNRVESIFTMAEMVQKLVPTVRIGVAHGQMGEKELERVMLKFIQGEYDVLVSTVLIENGLDIPRANTLLVNHAERFGLADLYQLRGRVGRSNRRAYAFFLIPAEEVLTPIAQRRLAALKEFSDLGAGFRLAALDLELRGAGNLLGAEQSGHLNSVGLDLYLKMLEQAVEELKGGESKPEVRTTLNLGLDIKIPERYIADERQRLRMYKRISSLTTSEQRADLEAELIDRYGAIPESVGNLFNYALLKSTAERLLVESIERKEDEIWLRFHAQAPVDPEKLKQFVGHHREATFRPDGVLRFRLAPHDGDLTDRVQGILQEMHA